MAPSSLVAYLEGLSRSDGGYGWEDQPDSYLTVTFCVIGSCRLLGINPRHPRALADYVRSAHPIRSDKTETRIHSFDPRHFLYEQMQSLHWLGENIAHFVPEVASWTEPQQYPKQYEADGYPLLREQALPFICRRLLGLPVAEIVDSFMPWFLTRQRKNGSFNHTPAADGSDGHLLNTWWSLLALHHVEGFAPAPDLADWITACQRANGGFTYQPNAQAGAVDDVFYTLAATWCLRHLKAGDGYRDKAIAYFTSLRNPDGGFGHRPGEPSCPMATLYALAGLRLLDALSTLDEPVSAPGVAPGHGRMGRPAEPLPDDLGVYTIQLQAPGVGSPDEAVFLARSLNIHLWGAKNSPPGWIERAQFVAAREGVPVTFFQANEEYRSYVGFPGLGMYTHLSDPTAPAGRDMGPALTGLHTMWEDFRERRWQPLHAADGRMIWQICDNEELSRILLDDSVLRGGYAALSTFHFGCRNMAYTVPFLFRYRHAIPFVALQDAHGVESWWWADHLTAFRTLFLGRAPTWEAWLEALDRHWVIAVRHDEETQFRTRLLGGGPGVQDYVKKREAVWRWWDPEHPQRLDRPKAVITLVSSDDPFEVGGTQTETTIRVRCQWEANHLAHLKRPLVVLTGLAVDGRPLDYATAEKHDTKGRLIDHYHTARLGTIVGDAFTVTATVRCVESGRHGRIHRDFSRVSSGRAG